MAFKLHGFLENGLSMDFAAPNRPQRSPGHPHLPTHSGSLTATVTEIPA